MAELRVLTPEDWAIWRELRLAALTEAPEAFGARLADWQGDGDRPDRWRGRLSIPDSYQVVALLDGRPVGLASGMPTDDPGTVELISMWVSPTDRGRRIGDQLVRSVLAWAAAGSAQRVRLRVVRGNETAEALYQRHSFRDSLEPDVPMPDGVRHERMMIVTLSASPPTR